MMISHVHMPETLKAVLNDLHDMYGREVQTIRGGTQVGLEGCPHEPVLDLFRSIKPEIDKLAGDEWEIQGSWTIRMRKGGFHAPHNHPEGDISGVYYVQTGLGGDLVIGDEQVSPKPGMLVLFHSETPHATTVYVGEEPRLTVAFDVVKA